MNRIWYRCENDEWLATNATIIGECMISLKQTKQIIREHKHSTNAIARDECTIVILLIEYFDITSLSETIVVKRFRCVNDERVQLVLV